MKTALVIGGGGSKGAFAVGAIEALLDAGMSFDIIAGTSTGALIAPMLAAGDIEAMIAHYTTVKTRDIIRKNWRGLFWKSLYHTRPLEKRVRRWVNENFDIVMNSRVEVLICAVSLQSKKVMYFSQKDSPYALGWGDPDGIVRCVMGSTNQPLLMPPIDFMGHQLIDGGVREIAPVHVVKEAGADRVIVIAHSTENPSGSSERYNNIFSIGGRTLDLMTDEIVKDDIQEESSVIVIRPDEELPTNGLDFDPKTMQKMRRLGNEQACAVLERQR